MRDGPGAGLAVIDALMARGIWTPSPGAFGARDLAAPGAMGGARGVQCALELVREEPERRFLEKLLRELAPSHDGR